MNYVVHFGWRDLLLSLLISLVWTTVAALFTALSSDVIAGVGMGVFWATEFLALEFIHLRLMDIGGRLSWVQRR